MITLKNMLRLRIFFLMILTLLTSCSVFSPVKTRIYNNYVINQIPHVTKRPYGKYILFVNPIKSNPLYDTNGMAYTAHPYRVEYFAKNRWADKPSKMLQSLISKSLQNSQFFNAVTSSAGNKIRYDYILNVQLTELRQVFLMHSSYVIFSIHVEIIDTSTYKIVASKELKTEVPVRIRSPLGGVISANQAVSITLKRLVNFCINSISANKRTFN